MQTEKSSYVAFDVETTITENGHPFHPKNKLCSVCVRDDRGTTVYRIEHGDAPYGEALTEIKERIENARYMVGFNIKFDMHWLRRYIPDIKFPLPFDCQLAFFILRGQTPAFPSLDDVAQHYGIGRKLDRVSTEYWANGIDTTEVPWELLAEYNESDVDLTDTVHKLMVKELQGPMRQLFAIQSEDILALQEMEWNGMLYDFGLAAERSLEVQEEIKEIDHKLLELVPEEAVNWGSSDHISAILYGGPIPERYRETYTRTLKDGTIKEKERWSIRYIDFPRLATPVRRTENAATAKIDDGKLASLNQDRSAVGKAPLIRRWSVAEPVLRRLRPNAKGKRIISLLLRRAELEKLDSTYYTGLIAKRDALGWEGDQIHGQFNVCIAATGRLSSSNPNLQNFARDIKDMFYSRYASD